MFSDVQLKVLQAVADGFLPKALDTDEERAEFQNLLEQGRIVPYTSYGVANEVWEALDNQ